MVPLLEELQRRLSQGQWLEVQREAEALLLLPPHMLSDAQRGKIHHAYGRALVWLGSRYEAIGPYEKAIHHAFQALDWDTLGYCRAEYGIVLGLIGDVAAANEMFAAYYLDLPRYKEATACEAQVRYNNGLALRRQHRYGEAVAAYHMALELFVLKGHTREAGDCHQNLAWLYLLRKQPDKALPHLEAAQSYVDRLPPDYRAQMLVCWAHYHLVTCDVGKAMEYVVQVLATNQEGFSDYHRSEAAWIGGEVALAVGDVKKAHLLGRLAQRHAVKVKKPELMNKACQLLAQVQERMGKGEEAAQ